MRTGTDEAGAPPGWLEIGVEVEDARTGWPGVVMAVGGDDAYPAPRAWLRPAGGGREWEVPWEHIRPLGGGR